MKRNLFAVLALALTIALPAFAADGLQTNSQDALQGYTLFSPLTSTDTYLIDMKGNTAHTWPSQYTPGQSVYLLEDGTLLRAVSQGMMGNGTFSGGGVGGGVQKVDPKGKVIWEYYYSNNQHCLHHDIELMPNGNILMIAWEIKSAEEAIAAGRAPDAVGNQFWPDHIIEVKPEGTNSGTIVWQWHVWDHLIQDIDPRRDNYGSVSEHPELIDINYGIDAEPMSDEEIERLRSLGYISGPAPTTNTGNRGADRGNRGRGFGGFGGFGSFGGFGGFGGGADFNHTNAIDYNPELDQIVLSVHSFSEIWIIDHSTTTEEAASHAGGKYKKGGDLLYRWGNPQAYKRGTDEDRQLFSQHDVTWIPKGFPGEGDLLLFNNGNGRSGGNYSSIDQISPPINRNGTYDQPKKNKTFEPKKSKWTYTADNKTSFYSSHISGAQRLPNGNTFVCSGEQGRFFEVTSKGEIVWDYTYGAGGGMPEFGAPGAMPGFRQGLGGSMMGMGMGGFGGPMAAPGGFGGGRRGARGNRGGGGMGMGMGMGIGGGIFRATRISKDYSGLKALELPENN